jgi:hypothetical protein
MAALATSAESAASKESESDAWVLKDTTGADAPNFLRPIRRESPASASRAR